MKRSFIREILDSIDGDTISFAGGLPNEEFFLYKKLRECAYKALNHPKHLQYSSSAGIAKLREQIAKRYSDRGFETKANEILITSGSQQALDIISRYFQNSSIILECPSYLGAVNIFRLNGLKLKKVSLNGNELDIKSFKKFAKKNKLAYLIPEFQNPTGFRYTKEQREQVVTICKENNILLIEDAPYSEIYFESKMPCISKSLPKSSFHLGSFSKVLSPALRLGWIRADKKLLNPLIAYKEAMDLHSSTISQHIVVNFLENKELFENHLSNLREKYRQKMLYFTQMLDRHLPEFKYQKPKGGMFIYGEIEGIETQELLHISMQKGVVFVPGVQFGGKSSEMRLNYTHSCDKDIEKGIKTIATALHQIQKKR